MKITFGKLLVAVVIVMTGFFVLYSLQGSEEGTISYTEQVKEDRAAKDEMFKEDEAESPLPDSLKKVFAGLNYYPVNKDYKIRATLEIAAIKETIAIATSKGTPRNYLHYGKVAFKLHGTEHRLTVLKPFTAFSVGVPDNYLFLAFTDETSGSETYGAGRYLEIEEAKNSLEVTLDFNYAYNPYCAYNELFDCPFPPNGNHLNVRVEAGEKNFKQP